jgi:hypothetical protein
MAREIAQELIDTTIGEWVHEKVSKNARTDRDGIRSRDGAIRKLRRGRGTHCDDVTLRTGCIECRAQLAHGVDASMANLVELIDRRDHRARARLRSEQRLRCVEDQKARDAYAIVRQPAHGTDRILDERHLNDDLIGQPGEIFAVAIYVFTIDRVHCDVDRRIDDTTDLDQLLTLVTLLLTQ